MALGGRAAEEVIFNTVTTGAENDIEKATEEARDMITMEGMKKLSEIRSYHMKVVYDNTVIEDDFIFGMVTNSISVGGFKRITGKYVELDDGVFEVTLIKLPHNMIELSNIMAALVDRDINTNYMYCFKTARLTIDSSEAIA